MTNIELIGGSVSERAVEMRLPFQFGNTEVWGAPEAHLTLEVEVDGQRHLGRAAQLMVPRWFNKDKRLSNQDTIDELRLVTGTALEGISGRAGSALGISRELRQDVAMRLPEVPALAAGFGPALVEMAMIDALCAAKGVPFWQAAKQDLFGLAAGVSADFKPAVERSLSKIGAPSWLALRHTVGFDAPLVTASLGPDVPKDGGPVTLEDVIAGTGIRAFKIKMKGDPDADLGRLRAINAVVAPLGEISVTLDANEQYTHAGFDEFLTGFLRDDTVATIRGATRFVEQPFARESALEAPVDYPVPLLIDESDDQEDTFERALDLGWSGTSIKSCKGVLRALLNKARADASGALLSGEDLTCQPGLCWQQDMSMMAACGVRDVERNGHHFAGGLQGSGEAEREYFLQNHADIYEDRAGHIGLRIAGGGVRIGSLDAPGFGHFDRPDQSG